MKVLNVLAGALGATAVATGALAYLFKSKRGFEQFLNELHSTQFRDVPVIFPEELSNALVSGVQPVIFDVRSPQEHAVSCIRNAQYLNPENLTAEDFDDLEKDRMIVVFCSMGSRAADVVRQLREFGFTNVRCLYGGLILWYNQGRSVYSAGRLVERIHPHNMFWGRFITRGGKITESEAIDAVELLYDV